VKRGEKKSVVCVRKVFPAATTPPKTPRRSSAPRVG